MNDLWTCRTDPLDEDLGLRWGHLIAAGPPSAGCLALLGFPSNEGVKLNQGRVGAAWGPDALRKALASLAAHKVRALCDLGDTDVISGDLAGSQDRFAQKASEALSQGARVIGLGGGHDIAMASFMAVKRAFPNETIGILNFDAHFDLRISDTRTSGTPFRDALMLDPGARYKVIGISRSSNTQMLFKTASELKVESHEDHSVPTDLGSWLDEIDHLYMSFDLDVLPAFQAPGVSAPNGMGVPLYHLMPLVKEAAASGKLRLFDVAELNPVHDLDGRTARTAARIIWEAAEQWI